jgi:PLD-like domain
MVKNASRMAASIAKGGAKAETDCRIRSGVTADETSLMAFRLSLLKPMSCSLKREARDAAFLVTSNGNAKHLCERARMLAQRPLIVALVALFTAAPAALAAPVEIHYSPVENLEQVDVALLRSARSKIDLAAYDLTDRAVIDALIDAKRRGVALRILLDPSQPQALDRLREISDGIRMKRPGPYMHLKSYALDGRLVRSGSANLSASGLKQQDNDIVIIQDAAIVRAFEARFQQIWSAGDAAPVFNPLAAAPSRYAGTVNSMNGAGADCRIKGNVNQTGERIYFLPGDRNYARVRMDRGAGKRWFCSEDQAIAAGWRAAHMR